MDGGSCSLNGSAELEGQDAQQKTNKGDAQADLGQQLEFKGVL